jgi:hypothetical protein
LAISPAYPSGEEVGILLVKRFLPAFAALRKRGGVVPSSSTVSKLNLLFTERRMTKKDIRRKVNI